LNDRFGGEHGDIHTLCGGILLRKVFVMFSAAFFFLVESFINAIFDVILMGTEEHRESNFKREFQYKKGSKA